MRNKIAALTMVICMLVCCTGYAYTGSSLTGSWKTEDIGPMKDIILEGIEGMDDLGDAGACMTVTGTVTFTFRQDGVCAMDTDVTLSLYGIEKQLQNTREEFWQAANDQLIIGNDVFLYFISGDVLILSCERYTVRFTKVPNPAYDRCAMHGHNLVSTVTRPADCCSMGEITCVCSVCGYSEVQPLTMDPNNHGSYGTYVSASREATCVSGGYSGDIYCAGCNTRVGTGYSTSALGHDWAPATAYAPMTCKRCGAVSGVPLQSQYLIVSNWKGVNMRAGQSGSASRLGHLDQGDIISFSGDLNYASDAWAQVNYGGRTAYVNTNTVSMPFVVQFSDYWSVSKMITVRRGSNLYILPDGNTLGANIVDTLTGDRQFTCIGTVKCVNSSLTYYVVRYDGKYTDDNGKTYDVKYLFVNEHDVK